MIDLIKLLDDNIFLLGIVGFYFLGYFIYPLVNRKQINKELK